MADYGIGTTVQAGFADSVEQARTALAEQGFGILTEIDVAATMRAKLGLDMEPYLILGACNPALAHRAIEIDPSIGLLLPCNVVVRALDATHILVEAMDPGVMVDASGNPALEPVAAEARTRVSAAIDAIGAALDAAQGTR